MPYYSYLKYEMFPIRRQYTNDHQLAPLYHSDRIFLSLVGSNVVEGNVEPNPANTSPIECGICGRAVTPETQDVTVVRENV